MVAAATAPKEFKVGVYLCIGQSIHVVNTNNAAPITNYKSYCELWEDYERNGKKLFVCLGEAMNKTKQKAEQMAGFMALNYLEKFGN